jgi:hypothetical protein
MAVDDDLARWHRELHAILNAVADTTRALGVAGASAGISRAVSRSADDRGGEGIDRIVQRVQAANAIAERLQAADPALAAVVQPLLSVPGERPEVDLRPWWSRLLGLISPGMRRTEAVESLETLRFEADAALMRAVTRLAQHAKR